MSGSADARRGVGPGRLDPTVRTLLRAFLSPAIADRYASALQPVAVADRDAAIAGAVTTLRARYFVLPEEIAAALLADTLWSVQDVATLLGMPVSDVRRLLDELATVDEPRIRAAPPEDVAEDEAEMVQALLAGLPTSRRRDDGDDPDDGDRPAVELTTQLPAYVGLPSLEERIAKADRRQTQVVVGTIVAIVALVVLTVNATRPGAVDGPGDDEVVLDIADDTDADAADQDDDDAPSQPDEDDGPVAPTVPREDVPVGDPVVAEARFVSTVDPATGEPGEELRTIAPQDEARLWVRMEQLPLGEVIVELTFTGPTGDRTVRPVLLTDRVPLLSVRLPDELGRDPGRYAAIVEVEGPDGPARTVVELRIVEPTP